MCGDEPAFTQGFAEGLLARCFFRKPPHPSLTLRIFRKPTSPPLALKKAPPLFPSPFPLRVQGMCQPPYSVLFFSKTYPSFLTLKEGSTSLSKPLPSQKGKDVPTALLGAQTASLYGWRTIRGLRQQRSCSFFVRDKPQGHGGAADANAGTWGLLLMGTQGHNAGGLWNHLADTPTVLHQD